MTNAITIWKDQIVLHWDGVPPPDAPEGAIHEPKDALYFWPHLRGHASWNQKWAGFLMQFSRQNLTRLYRQFGRIPVKKGQHRIGEIKRHYDEFRHMVAMAERIKRGEIHFPINYKMPPLAPYQDVGCVFLTTVPSAPLFADCGMGKTFMVLSSCAHHIRSGVVAPGRTLICAKLPTIETGWLADCEKFTDLKMVNLWMPQMGAKKGVSGKMRRLDEVRRRLEEPADLFVINHEGIWNYTDLLAEMPWEKVVVDESTILKSFRGESERLKGGQFGKALMRIARSAKWRIVMSGTPAPNGPEDLWGQYYFLDPDGFALEPKYRDFQHEYMTKIYFGKTDAAGEPLFDNTPAKWVPKDDTPERVKALSTPLAYRLKIRDHLKDLPPITIMSRKIAMTKDQVRHYKAMEKELSTEINDAFISVDMKLTQLLKLRQITGGFIRDHQELDHAIPDNPKLTMLDDLLNEEIGRSEKVIIFAQYRWEISTIVNRYKEHGIVSVYGGNNAETNLRAIREFIHGSPRIIVLHPKSAAHGLNLTMSHYMVFYSISHSEEENYQSIKRIERAGQKSAMLVYYLLCSNSIDELIYTTLRLKNRNQEKLLDQKDIDQEIVQAWSSAHEFRRKNKDLPVTL